jgi:AraC family transcriptional regulator, regulatory protein of adaptative response / DNA-3-methyladenine glycosylase II
MTLDAGPDTWLSARLACQEPFDSAGLLGFLALRAIPGVEQVTADRYTRTVRTTTGGAAVIELIPQPGQGHVLLRATLSPPGPVSELAAGCRRLLDADADPAAIDAALAADGLLSPLVRARPGLRVPGSYDGFELAVRAVLGQQVSVAAARTFAGRLAAQHGPPAPPGRPPGLTALFPTPAELAGADLSGLGLTTSRQRTLRALATAAATGRLSLDPGADRAETAARLAELPGIGPWTTGYIMMRSGDRDAFPPGDAGLRRAMSQLGAAAEHAARWRPWRSYAVIHLWTWETDHA